MFSFPFLPPTHLFSILSPPHLFSPSLFPSASHFLFLSLSFPFPFSLSAPPIFSSCPLPFSLPFPLLPPRIFSSALSRPLPFSFRPSPSPSHFLSNLHPPLLIFSSYPSSSSLTYFQQRYWVWDEELSGNNSRDDVIVTLNTVPVAAAWAVHTSEFLLGMLNGMFNSVKEKAVVTTTAEQILFTGYEDPVLDWLKEHPSFASGISYDKFAWFYGRNLTTYYDGLFNMKTGVDTLENLGKIDWWNKTRSTPFFSPPCNNVTGSAGEMFPPNQKPNHVVIYSSDLCMSVKLHYKENVTNDGIKGYRFWGSNTTFANGSVVPGNECYCVKGTCAPTGLLNAESCRMGAPAFISFPHFFNADPYLLNMVNGLKPEEEKHAFYMDLIPELGTPMNVAARVQINIRIQPYQGTGKFHFNRIDILKDLPNAYLPMLWFEEKAAMPPDMAPSVKFLLFLMNTPTLTIVWSLLVAIGVIVVVGLLLDHWRRHRSYDPLLDPLM
ncbi:scavenger receptor class B, croquemort type [Penaeus vannamei]|uniref:Scavenger receptor class B, croquemort type n=1 Tax=Penaeus vannamei TaxID=6689 RepID=A0A423SWL3_PENVA|nr:scavenger receptor class B, croquemort type [Penaeus vannamei]